MRFLLLIVFLFGAVVTSFAQMTDAQVIQLLKQAQKDGKTQQEMMLMLKDRGVTQEQMLRLKAQYEKMMAEKEGGAGKMTDTKSGGNRLRTINKEMLSSMDSLFVMMDSIPALVADRSEEVFGKDLFNNKKLTFEPILNIPTPENYKLAAGDEVIIDVWGDSEQTVRSVISPDGSIIVENLGPIYLSGLSVKEANGKIKNEFSKIYSAITAAQPTTFVNLTLGQIRSIQVNVMGEVLVPGSYTLPSLASVFHALYSAGGVNDIGTLREINIFRKGNKIATLDVYKYILEGGNIGDIVLQDGDNVVVGPYKDLVQIKGRVKRPMKYEMTAEESLQKLLDYAGGFTGDAYKKNVRLIRKSGSEYRIHTVKKEDFPSFLLDDGDVVEVDSIVSRFENKVSVQGAVYRPGDYSLDEDIQTVAQLVKVAEGLKGDAFTGRVLLYRENPDLTKQVQSLNLQEILSGREEDMLLQKNDLLYIPSTSELQENYIVTVRGEVKKPGIYPYIQNMSLEDLVLQAGGLLESASMVKVDVARRVKNPKAKKEALFEAKIFSYTLKDGLIIDGPKDFVLEPFDEIEVRRSPGYSEQQNVMVKGEVMYEGQYAKSVKNERLSSIINRAGGLTTKAYIKGARLERKLNEDERRRLESKLKLMSQGVGKDSINVKTLELGDTYYVGIELDKAMANPGSDYDVVLREGDRIIVPLYDGTVKVDGAVMRPNTTTYNPKKKLKEYIASAGGFAFRAKKRGTYIVYMNGMVAKRKGNSAKQIEPGCEIIVPIRPIRKGMSLAEIMSLASSTTSMAAMITTIMNNSK